MSPFHTLRLIACAMSLCSSTILLASCPQEGCQWSESEENCDQESCICDDYYPEEHPFLWGDDEDPSQEGVYDATWPGKREDSFFDSLTR